MKSDHELRQIGEAANESGLSIDTIRYYERLSLVEKPNRSEGGFRLYPKQTVEKLKFIKRICLATRKSKRGLKGVKTSIVS